MKVKNAALADDFPSNPILSGPGRTIAIHNTKYDPPQVFIVYNVEDVAESAATYESVSSAATEEGKKRAVQGNRGRTSTRLPTIRLSGMAMFEEDF